jgi:hypothetical protein
LGGISYKVGFGGLCAGLLGCHPWGFPAGKHNG